ITRSRGISWIVRRSKDSNRAHVRRSRNPELLEVGKEIFLPARSGQWSGQLRLPLGSCRAGQSEPESMEWYVFLSSVSLDFTSSPKVVSGELLCRNGHSVVLMGMNFLSSRNGGAEAFYSRSETTSGVLSRDEVEVPDLLEQV